MRFRIGVAACLVVLLTFSFAEAQHVTDDSIQYTPIPKPVGNKKENKIQGDQAQSSERKIAYFFSLQSGTLIGCGDCADTNGVASTSAITNGVTIEKKLRAGAGLGFDSYGNWKILPVYALLGYDLVGNKNKNAFFVQLQYGFSKAWLAQSYQGYSFQKAEGGRIFAPNIGYRINHHGLNVSFAVGAKLQRVFTYYTYPTVSWVNGEYRPGTNETVVKQDMSRLMLTMAVGF
jgi:hypothetical protein